MEIPDRLKFEFVSTDLVFDQVETLAQYQAAMREGLAWQGWSKFYQVARERLVHPEDRKRLSRIEWSSFPAVMRQFLDSLQRGDQLRVLSQQLAESEPEHHTGESGDRPQGEDDGNHIPDNIADDTPPPPMEY